jgi:hypothetical protein
MSKSRRTITILGLVLSVGAILVGREIGRRMQNKLDALDREISTCQAEKDRANREIQMKTHYVGKWGRIKALLQKTVQERQLEFDAYLIKLAGDSGVVIRQKDYNDSAMENHLENKTLNCNLKLDCKIGELADFIAMLDQEKDWLLRIENLTVKTADRSSFGTSTFVSELPSTKDIQADMVVSIPAASSKKEMNDSTETSKDML